MQFTGLKDSNGKEIYEGDIILLDSKFGDLIGASRINCLVGFKDGAFMYGRNAQYNFLNTYLWMVACDKQCKVIGNKFENPKLLEAKE